MNIYGRDITEGKQADEALKENEEKLRSILRVAPIGIGLTINRVILEANDHLCKMTGYHRAELINAPGRMLYPSEEEYEWVGREKYRQISERGTGAVETIWRKKDGTLINVLLSSTPLNVSDPSTGVTFTALDITERKRMEEEQARLLEMAQQRNAETEAVFAAINDAVLIYDTNMNVQRVNSMFIPTYGFDPVGLNVRDVIRLTQCRWPDGRPFRLEEQPTPRALRGEAVLNQRFLISRPDAVERALETSSGPLRVGEQITGSVTVWHDITDRRQMEGELRRSESQFKLLSETASHLLASENPQGIVNKLCRNVMGHLDCHAFFNFLVDENVGKLRLNACAGIPEEEARKIEWLDYGVAVCGCVVKDRERIVAEDIFNTPDIRTELVKTYGIQAYACHPLTVQGKLIGTLSFGTKTRKHFSSDDLVLMKTVTDQVAVAMERIRLIEGLRKSRDELELRVEERTGELKTYMARLEESNQALQDFASIASHDLQEPLRKVLSFGNMLKQKYDDSLGETGSDYLNRILNATERMQSLLKGLLEYSRVTTKADPFVEVELTKIVGEVVSDLEVRIERTGGKVQVGELPVIKGDPTQMRQLFQNLIGNALKFHKESEKPVVEVRSTVTNGIIQIEVKDNGIGFEEQYFDRIFAPFQRLHDRSSLYAGTGMGLAISKKIVERHGGTIRAESELGKGSTFIIRLPMKQTGLQSSIAR